MSGGVPGGNPHMHREVMQIPSCRSKLPSQFSQLKWFHRTEFDLFQSAPDDMEEKCVYLCCTLQSHDQCGTTSPPLNECQLDLLLSVPITCSVWLVSNLWLRNVLVPCWNIFLWCTIQTSMVHFHQQESSLLKMPEVNDSP